MILKDWEIPSYEELAEKWNNFTDGNNSPSGISMEYYIYTEMRDMLTRVISEALASERIENE